VVGDVYSLGVMLEQLLQPTPPPVRRVPADLLAVASKARATDPAERYASAEALAEDVERHLAHRPVRARRPGRWHRARLLLRRQWRASVIVALVAVMVLAFVLRLSEARHQAEQNAAAAAGIADVLVAAFDAADPGLRNGTPMTAREVLDLGARRLAHDRTVSPALRARMQAALGRAYQNLGQPLDAQTLLRDSVDGLVRTGAAPHEIADARASLAVQLLSAGQEKEALASAGHALAVLEQDDDPVVRLKALNARGLAQARLEQPAAAEQSFRAALALSRGGNRARLQRGALATMANLGDLYRSQGELDKAEAILRQAMAEASREQGVQGAEYQRVLRALSSTLLNQGRIDEALALAERGFALTRQMFGAGSSYTASAEAALAGQYLDLGRYQAADQHFRNSLQTSAAVDGVDSRAYAVKQYAHGLMEEARGDYARAEQNYRAALARYRALLGPGHADTLDVEMVLARLLLRTDRTAEAQAPLQQVAALWRRELPPGSPQLLVLRLVEIEWLTRAGQLARPPVPLPHSARTIPACHRGCNCACRCSRRCWPSAVAILPRYRCRRNSSRRSPASTAPIPRPPPNGASRWPRPCTPTAMPPGPAPRSPGPGRTCRNWRRRRSSSAASPCWNSASMAAMRGSWPGRDRFVMVFTVYRSGGRFRASLIEGKPCQTISIPMPAALPRLRRQPRPTPWTSMTPSWTSRRHAARSVRSARPMAKRATGIVRGGAPRWSRFASP